MNNPLITMTAVTGKPTKQEIFDYLQTLRDNGIEQVLLYPRSGCMLAYLEEEWFQAITDFVDAAAKLQMHLWLYDDFNWPSGDAQGRVTAIEKFRLKAIKTKGTEMGSIGQKSLHNSSLFGEKFFPDLLSEEAVDYFLQCTHEQYYARFGRYFGNVIRGIYTDEPSVGYCCDEDAIPYYDGIEADYGALCGRDFTEDMRADHADFYESAITVISQRFRRCFIEKLSGWCRTHGLIMTGHLLHEDTPFIATKHNGDLLKNLSSFMLPGIDELPSDFACESEMALFGTAEHVSGENGAMAELFSLGPCDMTYAKRRCMLYLAACHKIDHYFLAVSHMDMRGNLHITDFFSNFMSDQPDFAGMRLLAAEAATAAAYARKDYAADVYIRYPFSLCARHITGNLDMGRLTDLINRLTERQIQWKYIREDETREDAPIVALTEDLHYLFDGRVTTSAEEICDAIGVRPTITDTSGDLPRGLFVRRFADGNLVVLNLFAPAGTYLVNGQRINLETHGVFTGEGQEDAACKRAEIRTPFAIRYRNPNMIRTMYLNACETAEVSCETETAVTLAVRDGVRAYMGDAPICCHQSGNALSVGMRRLYGVSRLLSLPAGVTVIRAEKDLKYLPSVLVIGDFAAETEEGEVCSVRLRPRKRTFVSGERFSDYGAVEFTADVTLPRDTRAIELRGTNLYTCLYADDVLLGEGIAPPYLYPVREELQGRTVRLRILQYSSMAPMFGNVSYWGQATKTSQWRATPSTGKTLFGFEINYIL
ncbi:MAG: hypothetical protein IJ012_04690 [Clostridia bacterium]|nr:hypothetical protein [Clostridia bacterium]